MYARGDVRLADFLATAWPAPGAKCEGQGDSTREGGCGEGREAHIRTFLHGHSIVALSVGRLPPGCALPGSDVGQLWYWARPYAVRPWAAPPWDQHPCAHQAQSLGGSQTCTLSHNRCVMPSSTE